MAAGHRTDEPERAASLRSVTQRSVRASIPSSPTRGTIEAEVTARTANPVRGGHDLELWAIGASGTGASEPGSRIARTADAAAARGCFRAECADEARRDTGPDGLMRARLAAELIAAETSIGSAGTGDVHVKGGAGLDRPSKIAFTEFDWSSISPDSGFVTRNQSADGCRGLCDGPGSEMCRLALRCMQSWAGYSALPTAQVTLILGALMACQ